MLNLVFKDPPSSLLAHIALLTAMIHCSNGPPAGHVGHFMVIIDGAQKVIGHMFVKDRL